MTYNLHPIFVHFPIALLFLYSLVKIIPLQKWIPKVNWKDTERVLLVVGFLGAFLALATGETAEHLVHPDHQLVEMHSTFASLATFLYGLLLAGKIAFVLNHSEKVKSFFTTYPIVQKILSFIEKFLNHRKFTIFLALIALITIIIAGLLGGAIVYGTTADPLAKIILPLLGINL